MKTLKVLLQEVVSGIKAWVNSNFAQESNTVHKTGNETVNGNKTFSGRNTFSDHTYIYGQWKGLYFKNPEATAGTAPSGDKRSYISFTDSNDYVLGSIILNVTGANSTWLQTGVFAKDVNDSSQSIYCGTQYRVYGNGEKYFNPSTNGDVYLGTSTLQWKSIYAQSYYYNGTAWGLDKANAWSEHNRFNKNVSLSDVTSYTDCTLGITALSNVIYYNTRGSSNIPSYGTFCYIGYSNTLPYRGGVIQMVRSTDKRGETNDGFVPDTSFNLWRLQVENKFFDCMEAVRVTNDGSENSLKPIVNNTTDLGISTNKWKSINGVNPGALSLPDKDEKIVIDTTNWTYTGSYANQILINSATQIINGWLYIRIENTTPSDYITIRMNAISVENPTLIQSGSNATPIMSVLFPVVANVPVYVYLTKTPAKVYLYKCLGNV